jgi:hypothetical protein
MMAFSPQEAAQVRQSIEALNAEFAWLIDHKDGAGVSELFTFSGVYDMADRAYHGREEIAGFFEARKARGRRTARHVFSNLRLLIEGAERAAGTVILTLYAHDGEPPYPTGAILIADYNDVYRRGHDNQWRYESRTIVPVFGGVPDLTKPQQAATKPA